MSNTRTEPPVSREQRQKIIDRTNWLAVLVDALAFVGKLSVGISVRSPALIADAMHSLSDLLADIPIILLAKISHQDADQEHPYGHARFETLGTVMLGGILLAVALGIAYESTLLFFSDSRPEPSWAAIITVVLAIALKEAYFQYAIRQSRKARSPLLEANAWHARSDSLSSLVVLVGVGATALGFPTVEIIAALLVALLIGKMGISLAWESIQVLVDRGVEPEQQQAFIATLKTIPGVRDVHMMRTRLMGQQVFIDAHIQVGGYLSVSEGHQINEWALRALKESYTDVADVTLHIDHEDDLPDHENRPLAPLRPTIESLLHERQVRDFDRLIIHYRHQHAELELRFASNTVREAMAPVCQEIVREVPWIEAIVLTDSGQTIKVSD